MADKDKPGAVTGATVTGAAAAEAAADHLSDTRFVRETGLAANIADLIDPVIADLGFRLVRVQMSGGDGPTLQIMAERADGTFSIDDCATLSRQLSPVLDAYDPLPGAYRLEISSPGIDRPLVRPSDFEDWSGYEAKIELRTPVNGRKRFRGIVDGFENGEVRLECDIDQQGRVVLGFPMDLIGDAKLVLNDELIRETLRRTKKLQEGAPDAPESQQESLQNTAQGIELSDDDVEQMRAAVPGKSGKTPGVKASGKPKVTKKSKPNKSAKKPKPTIQ